jgi:hypothetical protein
MIEQPIDPPESLTDNPTSDEIADMVLRGEIDMSKWYNAINGQSDAFTDLIGIYASYEWRKELTAFENRSELLSEIVESIRNNIKRWAELEAGEREGGFKTLL